MCTDEWQGKTEPKARSGCDPKLLIIDYPDNVGNRDKIEAIRSAWKRRTGDQVGAACERSWPMCRSKTRRMAEPADPLDERVGLLAKFEIHTTVASLFASRLPAQVPRSGGCNANAVQCGERFVREFQGCGRKVLAQMLDRRRARNEKNVGRPLQQPRERHLRGSRME